MRAYGSTKPKNRKRWRRSSADPRIDRNQSYSAKPPVHCAHLLHEGLRYQSRQRRGCGLNVMRWKSARMKVAARQEERKSRPGREDLALLRTSTGNESQVLSVAGRSTAEGARLDQSSFAVSERSHQRCAMNGDGPSPKRMAPCVTPTPQAFAGCEQQTA